MAGCMGGTTEGNCVYFGGTVSSNGDVLCSLLTVLSSMFSDLKRNATQIGV